MDISERVKTLTFWRHFEEHALKACNIDGTHTRQREEPDQRNECFSSGVLTITNTREEPDQDNKSRQYCAIPNHISRKTETQTFTREEPDPGPENKQYYAIPKRFFCGPETLTEQREEPHQDESSQKYSAIPINPRV
ncbi:MAG: hypothetical protein JW715_15095 [Sedimentisphaerales bacterium]|nr:hypothetical protein [Sedimentisphaerales bacterium]